jgi:hypothetical protein
LGQVRFDICVVLEFATAATDGASQDQQNEISLDTLSHGLDSILTTTTTTTTFALLQLCAVPRDPESHGTQSLRVSALLLLAYSIKSNLYRPLLLLLAVHPR